MPTANGTPTDAWTLVKNASVAAKGGVTSQFADIEIATTNSATAPAASFKGHPVFRGRTEPVTLKVNDRLWWRLLDPGASGDPVGVYTIEDD